MNNNTTITPPWSATGKNLESKVRKALYTYQMIEGVTKVAIALSGGKDSLTLLLLLNAISGRGFPKVELTAIHVHGAYSCGAGVHLNYLQNLCDSLEIAFIAKKAPPPQGKLECYSCSRVRRTLLFETAKENGIDTIAFGHHQDDNSQTIIMNLFHKGEFAGILPNIHMKQYGVTIIRPLIFISEEQIREFAKQNGFHRILCQCPVGQTSARKKVDGFLSNIEHLYPNARKNIASAGLLYGSDKAKNP